MRDLEFLHEHIHDFLPPWQKESAVHKFAKVVADEMFIEDTDGPYVEISEDSPDGSCSVRRYLPVDVALNAYGIKDAADAFDVPERDGRYVREGNVTRWEESSEVANACYDYAVDLQWTAAYDRLLAQITDEVFHTLFPDRGLMSQLNEMLAFYVRQQEAETYFSDHELTHLFKRDGCLKRVSVPRWARRAVFFRDHGHCTACGTNLTGYIDALPATQFDHVVPLDLGGLNDVTNLQLLCQPCNRDKSSRLVPPSGKYRRFYDK